MPYGNDPALAGWAWPDGGIGELVPSRRYGLPPPSANLSSYYGYGDPNLAGPDSDQVIRQTLSPEVTDNLARLLRPATFASALDQSANDPDLDALIYGVRNAGLGDTASAAPQPDDLTGLSGPDLAGLIRRLPPSGLTDAVTNAAAAPQVVAPPFSATSNAQQPTPSTQIDTSDDMEPPIIGSDGGAHTFDNEAKLTNQGNAALADNLARSVQRRAAVAFAARQRQDNLFAQGLLAGENVWTGQQSAASGAHRDFPNPAAYASLAWLPTPPWTFSAPDWRKQDGIVTRHGVDYQTVDTGSAERVGPVTEIGDDTPQRQLAYHLDEVDQAEQSTSAGALFGLASMAGARSGARSRTQSRNSVRRNLTVTCRR